ncbi:DUF4430 domain-containing protein [Candidatus Thorarchaeota archaeon]|nr:MAG: DUF4430 domain-containing protein [Candidatus Thorarchaeota archaeon]
MTSLKQIGQLARIVVVLLLVTPMTMQTFQVDAVHIPSATGISLTVDFGNGTVSISSALEAADVYNLTIGIFDVDAIWTGNLVYINAIDGVYRDETRGWQYWVNGNYATGAANLYNLHDGDSVLWNLTVSNFHTSTEPDYSLVIGGVLLAVGGLAFLVILYWKSSRR